MRHWKYSIVLSKGSGSKIFLVNHFFFCKFVEIFCFSQNYLWTAQRSTRVLFRRFLEIIYLNLILNCLVDLLITVRMWIGESWSGKRWSGVIGVIGNDWCHCLKLAECFTFERLYFFVNFNSLVHWKKNHYSIVNEWEKKNFLWKRNLLSTVQKLVNSCKLNRI